MAVSTFGADGPVTDDASAVGHDDGRMALRAGHLRVHALELESRVAVVVERHGQPAIVRGVAAIAVDVVGGELPAMRIDVARAARRRRLHEAADAVARAALLDDVTDVAGDREMGADEWR